MLSDPSFTPVPRRRDPSPLELRNLERIGDRRAEIKAATPADPREADLRRPLLELLDLMEEELCHCGNRSPVVRAGWKQLARFESFGTNGNGGRGHNSNGNGRRGPEPEPRP